MISNKEFWKGYTQHLFRNEYSINNIIHSISSTEKLFLDNISGKRIFHPFCNFGMNSFSLEQLGGSVTALDFNDHAIEMANQYKDKIKSEVEFVCGDFFEYNSDELYDIVYASYGVLDWVEDITVFLEKVKSLLKVGGEFILIEYHSDFFKEKLSNLGTRISDTNFEIKSGFKKISGTSSKSILGNGYDSSESITAIPNLHDTNDFIQTSKDIGFEVTQLEYFDYIPWKMGNDILVGRKKYRNRNLKDNEKMSFGIKLVK